MESKKALAVIPPRTIYSITQITGNLNIWTAIVQVVECHRTQQSKGSRGALPKSYKRYLLVDEHGTKVSAVVYEPDIDRFSIILQPFKRFRISNAKLTLAFSFFKVGAYNFSWIINSETPCELIAEPTVPNLPFTYTVCPFSDFVHHADRDIGFNVRALAVYAFPQKQVNLHATVREIVIIDERKKPMILSLWNSFGDIEGNDIAKNIANVPLIIGVNMKSTTFHGLSLATRMYSCILVNPPIHDTITLKEWYKNNKCEINEMIHAEAYKNLELLLPPPSMAETIDVPTAVATINTVHTAWVAGKIRFTATKQTYYMSVCQNCQRKVSAPAGWFLHCSGCDMDTEVELRAKIPMELVGGDKSLPIIMTTPNVEHLTAVTATQLRDSDEFDLNIQDDLQATLDKLQVVCFVKKYDSNTFGKPTSPGIRYGVVKAYTQADMQKLPALLPSSTSTPHTTVSPDDKQLFTPNTKKQLTEIEGIPAPEKTAQSNLSTKRSLDFTSTTAMCEGKTYGTASGSQSDHDSQNAPITEDIQKSPIKKAKDKLKLN